MSPAGTSVSAPICLHNSVMKATQNLRISLSDFPLGSKSAPPFPPPMLTKWHVKTLVTSITRQVPLTPSQGILEDLFEAEPGEISEPYRSDLGYHVFRLESKDGLEGEGLTRARAQIREILFRQKYEARLDAWLREIRERAIIEVRM